MTRAITMTDLRKLSAAAIESLPYAVPIKSGDSTVGLLVPVRRSDTEGMRRLLAEIDEATAAYTPEQRAAIEEFVQERGID